MELKEFLQTEDVAVPAFAEEMGVRPWTIYRYIRKERKPTEEQMAKIYKLTNGKVAPNDWFDLPGLLGS